MSRSRRRLQPWLIGVLILAFVAAAVIGLTGGVTQAPDETYPTSGGLLHFVIAHFVNFMNARPAWPALVLAMILMTGPATLFHELGHAVVARRRLQTSVDVEVGAPGRLGRAAGSATFDARNMTAKDALAIALAGPAASLLWFVVCARAWDLHPDGLLGALLWVATFEGLFGSLVNLLPMTLLERDGNAIRTDGRQALDAWRALRGAMPRG
jgi:hypothetical protein